jgi:hypothetical protein
VTSLFGPDAALATTKAATAAHRSGTTYKGLFLTNIMGFLLSCMSYGNASTFRKKRKLPDCWTPSNH